MINLFLSNGFLAFLAVCDFVFDPLSYLFVVGDLLVLGGNALIQLFNLLIELFEPVVPGGDALVVLFDSLIKLFELGVHSGGALCRCGHVFVGGGESGRFGCTLTRHAGFEMSVLSLGRL